MHYRARIIGEGIRLSKFQIPDIPKFRFQIITGKGRLGWANPEGVLEVLIPVEIWTASEGFITEKHEYDSKSRSFNKYNLQSYLVLL